MRVERGGGSINLFVPVDGPDGWSPGTTTAEVAIVGEGVTPAAGDWHSGNWSGTEIQYLWNPAAWVNGDYIVKVRLTAGLEQVVKTSTRLVLG